MRNSRGERSGQTVRRSLLLVYFLLSVVALAVIIADSVADIIERRSRNLVSETSAIRECEEWTGEAVVKADGTLDAFANSCYTHMLLEEERRGTPDQHRKIPPWLRPHNRDRAVPPCQATKSIKKESETTRTGADFLTIILDMALLRLPFSELADLIDTVLTSPPRLIVIVNLLLVLTFLLHSALVGWFLGTLPRHLLDWKSPKGLAPLVGFAVLKLFLVSAAFMGDPLDMLILLSWYTTLLFLKSLAHLAAGTIKHNSGSGQPPHRGARKLLLFVLLSDFLVATVLVAFLYPAGWHLLLFFICDCILLAIDVGVYLAQDRIEEVIHRHLNSLGQLCKRQAEAQQQGNAEEELLLDQRVEQMKQDHACNLSVFDTLVVHWQIVGHSVAIFHGLHFMSFLGLQLTGTPVDYCMAYWFYSRLSSACKMEEGDSYRRVCGREAADSVNEEGSNRDDDVGEGDHDNAKQDREEQSAIRQLEGYLRSRPMSSQQREAVLIVIDMLQGEDSVRESESGDPDVAPPSLTQPGANDDTSPWVLLGATVSKDS